MIGVGAAGFVPIAFVDGDHFAGVAGDAAVGEEVGRVGEDEVDGIFRKQRQKFQAIALVEAQVVLGVIKDGRGKGGHGIGANQEHRQEGLCHRIDRSGSLIKWEWESREGEGRRREEGKSGTQRTQRAEAQRAQRSAGCLRGSSQGIVPVVERG